MTGIHRLLPEEQAPTDRPAVQKHMALLLGHVILTLLWPAFNSVFTVKTILGGFLFVTIILAIYHRPYLVWLIRIGLFLLYLVWSIAVSSFQVIVQIVTRRTFAQAIVRYELTADSDIEVLILATAVTLTPGTISVDTRYAANGQRMLYVHLLDGRNPEQFRVNLKYGFEQRIRQLIRE